MDSTASARDSRPTAKRRRRGASADETAALPPLETWPGSRDVTESHPAWSAGTTPLPDELQVIVRVTEEGYVPDCVQVRARISDWLFTADIPARDIDMLERDPRVESVGLPRSVHPADAG